MDEKSPRTETLRPLRLIGGKYRLGRLIGEGAMGAVYEAEHVELGVKVAIKILGDSHGVSSVAAERARREARAAAQLRHDNIVAVTDTGDEQGVPYLVMELLHGESLGAMLRRERVLGPELAISIVVEVLEGLRIAHQHSILHRDLKPDNVFLARQADNRWRVKILDFGVAKLVGEGVAPLTAADAAVGTPHYMSPEQVGREAELDERIDVYAVGVMLYRLLTGAVPFGGRKGRERDLAILRGDFPPPRRHRPELDPEIEAVILKAMATDRDARYPNVGAMRDALNALMPERRPIGMLLSVAEAPTLEYTRGVEGSVAADTAAPETSRTGLWAAALALVGLAAAAAVWSPWSSRGPKQPEAVENSQAESERAVLEPQFLDSDKPPLVFGMTTYVPEEIQRATYGPIATFLGNQLEREVKIKIAVDSPDLLRRFLADEFHFAALDPRTYVRVAAGDPRVVLLASPVTKGGASFEVHIVARADSAIDSLDALRGKTFCFVPSAASGDLIPRAMLKSAGIDPMTDLPTARLVDNHLTALRYVLEGKCHATAVYASLLFEADSHGLSPYSFRIVATSDRIPNDAYCSAPHLEENLRADLREALLSLVPGSPEAESVFGKNSELVGFVEASDADYGWIRQALIDSGELR